MGSLGAEGREQRWARKRQQAYLTRPRSGRLRKRTKPLVQRGRLDRHVRGWRPPEAATEGRTKAKPLSSRARATSRTTALAIPTATATQTPLRKQSTTRTATSRTC